MRDFLINRDETGREIVFFKETGKKYYIEYIGKNHTNWGDLNLATGKIEGSYGNKSRGSITKINQKSCFLLSFNDLSYTY